MISEVWIIRSAERTEKLHGSVGRPETVQSWSKVTSLLPLMVFWVT